MPLKLVHISDTHLREFNPEPGDILVHSGDALNYGDFNDLIKFRQQLEAIKDSYKHIIYVPGNHDRIFEEDPGLAEEYLKEALPHLHVLHNKEVEIEGLKFYGTADQPEFCNWAFNKPPHELLDSYANIPEDVDVLVTHCPARGIRDQVYGEAVGSPELTYNLPRLKKLKAHLFGHIHYSRGIDKVNDIWYSNAAMVDERYQAVHEANVIEIGNSDV